MNPQERLARLTRTAVRGRSSTAARTPFVLLLVGLLGSGLLALLLLNASLNQGSFQVSRLEQKTKGLTEEEQALEQDVASYSDPETLRRRAHELGMVPGGPPAFVSPDGTVRGSPQPATTPPQSPPAEGGESGEANGGEGQGELRPQPRVQPEGGSTRTEQPEQPEQEDR